MKWFVGLSLLFLAPTVFAASMQATPAEPAPQASNDSARSPSGRATSHDRHARKHRASSNHHRRPRTTAKGHIS